MEQVLSNLLQADDILDEALKKQKKAQKNVVDLNDQLHKAKTKYDRSKRHKDAWEAYYHAIKKRYYQQNPIKRPGINGSTANTSSQTVNAATGQSLTADKAANQANKKSGKALPNTGTVNNTATLLIGAMAMFAGAGISKRKKD